MSTIAEIEAAVEQLPRKEQESLLEYLVHKLGSNIALAASAPQRQRESWLLQLDGLRARGAALAQRGTPLQEVLDDIRSERHP